MSSTPVAPTRWWRWSTTTTITIRLSKAFSGALTSASCASEAKITRDSIYARGTKENLAAVVCKRTAANTKSLIGPTDRPTRCFRNVNVTFTGPFVLNAIVRVASTVAPKTKPTALSVRGDGNACNVVLTYAGPKPSRVIIAGTRIVMLVNNTWTLNPINVSFKFGRWMTKTTCNRPSTCSLTLKPNKSIANTCPTSCSVSALTRTSSISGMVTCAFKSFWCQGGKQPLTVLAYNFQGYDSYPVIDTWNRLRLKLGQNRNRGKILQLQCLASSVHFIDSMSFFQMKLAKFPKTFGLTELKKGYFPHLFNTDDHHTYVRSLPNEHYYMPDGMSVEDRDVFRRWHAKLTREGYVFDFR